MKSLPARWAAVLVSAAAAFLGSASIASALDLELLHTYDGQVMNGQFGISCVVVGDMDGDGYAEFAIGASSDSTLGRSAGRVFIFRGGESHLADPPAWIINGVPGDLLGEALAPAGDQDGDGLADLLIGAPGNTDVNPAARGRVLLVYGSNPLGMRAPVEFDGDDAGDQFGESLTAADLNGDGLPEIAVGAPGSHFDSGKVKVYRGGNPSPSLLFTLHARGDGDEFGSALAGPGATRGGPYGDLLVGAPFNSDADIWAGKSYLYFGSANPDTVPDMSWSGVAFGDFFGSALAGVGDVNGDGLSDYVIGAPDANSGMLIDNGSAYLFLGAANPPALPAVTINGSVSYEELGLKVAGIGDVNGDGRHDFAVGAPGTPDSFTAGEVQVFLGRTVPSALPDTVLQGEVTDDMFGHSISNGGHIGKGGRDLFLVGSDEHMSQGRAYLYGRSPSTVDVPVLEDEHRGHAWLAAPWPNPSRDRVRFAVELERAARAHLGIFDIEGRRIASLLDAEVSAGRHELVWPTAGNGSVPHPGLYWAWLSAGGSNVRRRFVILGP